MDFPCSYGEADLPRNITRSGVHVVTEKYEDFYMSNPAAGYSNVARALRRADLQQRRVHPRQPEQHRGAGQHQRHQRLHQPVDLENAQQYFSSAIYGDPVEVTGTSIELSYADGDIWDWAVAWDEWVSMSALSPQRAAGAGSPAPRPSRRRTRRSRSTAVRPAVRRFAPTSG